MRLAGRGAVAIWHDIAPEGRRDFYAWHGIEHMPERAGIPGFLRGRRYVSIGGAPEFFNLYETVSRFTVTGAEYLARLNAPTRWTIDTVRHFRGVARSLCEVAASFGEGQGGLIATFRYCVDDARGDAHRTRMAQSVLPALAGAPGVAGCHLLVADADASAVDTAERKARGELCGGLLADRTFEDADAARELGIYRLQNSRAKLPWSAG